MAGKNFAHLELFQWILSGIEPKSGKVRKVFCLSWTDFLFRHSLKYLSQQESPTEKKRKKVDFHLHQLKSFNLKEIEHHFDLH
jgi:hypothetical protein